MVLFFVYIVFYVDPASGLPNTINVSVYSKWPLKQNREFRVIWLQ